MSTTLLLMRRVGRKSMSRIHVFLHLYTRDVEAGLDRGVSAVERTYGILLPSDCHSHEAKATHTETQFYQYIRLINMPE